MKTNDVYVRALYQLLARLNNNELTEAVEIGQELIQLADFMESGRFYYTEAKLRMCYERMEARLDIEAIKATLLLLMHGQNEMNLRRELRARGWKL